MMRNELVCLLPRDYQRLSFVRCCVPLTVANFYQKIVLDLLQLNSIYGESGFFFCCLCSEKKMEGVRVHSNTPEIAAGSIFLP